MVSPHGGARHLDRGEAVSRLSGPFAIVYEGSAGTVAEWPRWSVPEVALAGRSNAGKSSLLNCLGGRRDLARVSRTPGRTRRLHFFSCSTPRGKFGLVDLPGYGYARASREERERWGASVEEFLLERPNLRALALVFDVRRDPDEDESMIERLTARRSLRLLRVATKVDKLGRAERIRRLQALETIAGEPWIAFSARTREGRETLIEALVVSAEG